MITPFETLRMRWLYVSAMYRLPAESTATPWGSLNWALVAGPLSPLKPAVPFPAARVKTPVVASNRRTTLRSSAKKRLPALSTATEPGERRLADVPANVHRQPPPANVLIV